MTDLPPVDIQWQAPAECPDAASVRARVERLLGKSLQSLPGLRVQARGVVQRNEAGNWELNAAVSVGEHAEQETLVAKRCRALADALALKLALAIDPLAVIDAVESPPEPAPEAASVPERPAVAVPPAATPLRFGLRLVGAVGLGPLPGATPGVALYGSLERSAFRLELGAETFWSGVARYAAPAEVGADLQVFAGAARGCVAPSAGQFRFPICGGFELGVMRGAGFGVDTTARTTGVWGGVVVGPAVQLQLTGHLSLWVEAAASLTLLRPEFHMRNLGTLYRPPAGGSRAAAGFEVNF